MPRVQRTAAARKDYYDIFLHIAEQDIEAGRRLLMLFDEKLQLIADFPGMGHQRDELRPGMRSFPIGDYLVFYRELSRGGIELVRAVHGARDLKKLFRPKRR